MKALLSLALIATIAAALTGCSGDAATTTDASTTNNAGPATATQPNPNKAAGGQVSSAQAGLTSDANSAPAPGSALGGR